MFELFCCLYLCFCAGNAFKICLCVTRSLRLIRAVSPVATVMDIMTAVALHEQIIFIQKAFFPSFFCFPNCLFESLLNRSHTKRKKKSCVMCETTKSELNK